MDIHALTLRKIRSRNNLDDSVFLRLYERLILGDTSLTDNEKFFLLKIAAFFLNSKDENVERLGYRIILRYSNLYTDYLPLHDVALSRDYIPITKFIERLHFHANEQRDTFSQLFVEAYQEGFKIEGDSHNVYRSLGQIVLNAFSGRTDNIAVVAPTSYGKSEMIVKKIQNTPDANICVIVPTKALLAQTKKALLRNENIRNNFRKIITHPDMYKEEDGNFLAALTQERLLRLLQKNKDLHVDLVLVDEAHNILEDSERSHLLAQVLLILQTRKNDFTANFFTPFIVNIDSLKIRNHAIEIEGLPINEYMKIERFYTFDLETKELNLYDQFLDRTFNISVDQNISSDIDFISTHKASKNIIYLNRPMAVERFALGMARQQNPIELSPEIEKSIRSIADFIHPEYNLIRCIRSGILFHHGGVPDIIRLYVEDIYSKYGNFEFIITTSTLLEGVNIPAEKIFILNPTKGRKSYLSASQFKNLIGRVCRFKEVFDGNTGSLRMLEPEIYLVKGHYSPSNLALSNFYRTRINSGIRVTDEVQNPMLVGSENTEKVADILEYLENMEPGSSGLDNITTPTSDIGELCYANNIHDFEIISNENTLASYLDAYRQLENPLINSAENLINAIVAIFFNDINLYENRGNITRLKENQEARNFYSMFVNWRSQGAPYPQMINRFLRYWNRRIESGEALIYIGPKWGEEVRGDGYNKLYVNMLEKDGTQRINLAIAKIKEEQEFIDFNILKYLEVLTDLGLVDQNFYDHVKFGTSDEEIICMLKNGFSMELARLLTTSYRESIELDLEQEIVQYDEELLDHMRQNDENDILIFEAEGNL